MRIHALRQVRGEQRGAALVWALLISFVMAASSFILVNLGRSSSQTSELHRRKAQAANLSEAALAFGLQAVEDAYNANIVPAATGTVDIDGQTVSFTIEQVDPEASVMGDDGLASFLTLFRVEGTATVGRSRERARSVVAARRIPLFQFAMFFENDMNFWLPAPMTIKGRLHCNGRVFAKTANTLNFNTNYFGAVGGYFGTTILASTGVGTVSPQVRQWVEDIWDPAHALNYFGLTCENAMDLLGIPSDHGFDSTFAGYDKDSDGDFDDVGDWLPFSPGAIAGTSPAPLYMGGGDGHTLHTEADGLEELIVPPIDTLSMYAASAGGDYAWDAFQNAYAPVAAGTGTHSQGSYHENADLSIISWPNGTWKAYNQNGIEVTASVATAITATSMYDARQAAGTGQKIQLTSIDVSKLNTTGYFPANGLLYVAGYGAGTGKDALGFELNKGSQLQGALTVVSPNSVYVRGDYNTSAQKPASVIADAVNLLSNAWNNSKASGGLPTASNTTYNLSVVTGDVDEASSGYFQGGPMNALRRHETWTGKTETVKGSIVCMFRSQYATGRYRNDTDYFRPPTRVWNYDPNLDVVTNLPPFTPQSIEVTPVVTW